MPVGPAELSVGDALPTFRTGPISRTDIVRYAGAGGDFNVIHHDDEFARAAGYPSVFAMGLLQGGMLAQRLARWVGAQNVRRLRLRYTGQVWPGDTIEFSGTVVAVDDAARPYPLATCELVARTDRENEVVRGQALVATVRSAR